MKILATALSTAFLLAGCELDPLVEDQPGASVHVLPPGADVPRIETSPDRLHQLEVHDGIDDRGLEEAEGVVERVTGRADGVEVSYWKMGEVSLAAGLVYQLVRADGDDVVPVDHPYVLDSLPGDNGYSPVRRLQHVRVTDRYAGELLPTVRALIDAEDLGLIEPAEPAGVWLSIPVVPPDTRLDVGDGIAPAPTVEVFAEGFRVDVFLIGGPYLEQPTTSSGSVPTGQLSFLAEAEDFDVDDDVPILQFGIPTEAPGDSHNYTPLATVLHVRLAPGVLASDITSDADLFTRSSRGSINGVTDLVDSFEDTGVVKYWPVQIQEGSP